MSQGKLSPVRDETIYRLKNGENGRWWFIGKDEHDLWVWDRNNQNGIMGDMRTFRIGEGDESYVQVHGPWNSNADALFKETGERPF
jgi:hypothetical protein